MSATPPEEFPRLRRFWDRGAPAYDRQIRAAERLLFGRGRAWVCGQAAGRVLEVAVGTGRNFPFYPPGVRLTAVDFSPAMLAVARRRAVDLGLDVQLQEADAGALPFAAAAFDTVVCTLSLCSIPDDRRALAEMARVLRPGGRLLLLDHVRSTAAPVRLVQRLLELLVGRFDHQLRRPADLLPAAGLVVERAERSRLGVVERLAARKPA